METDIVVVILLTGAMLDFLILKALRAIRLKEQELDAELELGKRISAHSQAGDDYIKHIVECDQCKYYDACPIGLMLYGAYGEHDKHLEALKHV